MKRMPIVAFSLCLLATAAATAHLLTARKPTLPQTLPAAAVQTPPALGELTRYHGVELRVSSEVNNGKDIPDRLVDGNMDTAWQSRSGDLTTAWIDVDLPAGVTVHRLGLTEGFVKLTTKQDLFTGNVRVAEIDAFYNEKQIANIKLNPELRSIQYTELMLPSGQGGTLRLAVRKVLPGTNKSWKELCISELSLLGTRDTDLMSVDAGTGTESSPRRLASFDSVGRRESDACRARLHLSRTSNRQCGNLG